MDSASESQPLVLNVTFAICQTNFFPFSVHKVFRHLKTKCLYSKGEHRTEVGSPERPDHVHGGRLHHRRDVRHWHPFAAESRAQLGLGWLGHDPRLLRSLRLLR